MAWAHGLVQISIHSAARAETLYHLCQQHRLWYFNPLRREGGDYGRGICGGCAADISIHSAARAETNIQTIFHVRMSFQSTPPRGRRPSRPWFAQTTLRISIHSAARAETFPPPLYYVPHTDFNPLRREGGDGNQDGNRCLHRDFNPLRREGGDMTAPMK